MKISEAIKIGMQGRTQCVGRYWDIYTEDITEIKIIAGNSRGMTLTP
jgi:hypothetical protein